MLGLMETSQRGPFHRDALDRDECLGRISQASLARVVISVRCLPAALPVYVHVADHHVLIASGEQSVIEAARRNDVLAVQVDGADDDGTTWSVQATGIAHIPGPTDALRIVADNSRLRAALESGATVIAIASTVVGGERVRWSFPR